MNLDISENFLIFAIIPLKNAKQKSNAKFLKIKKDKIQRQINHNLNMTLQVS